MSKQKWLFDEGAVVWFLVDAEDDESYDCFIAGRFRQDGTVYFNLNFCRGTEQSYPTLQAAKDAALSK